MELQQSATEENTRSRVWLVGWLVLPQMLRLVGLVPFPVAAWRWVWMVRTYCVVFQSISGCSCRLSTPEPCPVAAGSLHETALSCEGPSPVRPIPPGPVASASVVWRREQCGIDDVTVTGAGVGALGETSATHLGIPLARAKGGVVSKGGEVVALTLSHAASGSS